MACAPGTMTTCDTLVAVVQKVKFFTDVVKTKQKLHITLGHQTAIGLVHFFSKVCDKAELQKLVFNKGNLKNYGIQYNFRTDCDYDFEDEVKGEEVAGGKEEEAKVAGD